MLGSNDKFEHAGFYWAEAKGLFKDNQLNVTLMTPQPQESLNLLEYGDVDIALETLPIALQKNQKSQSICLVKQINYNSGIAFVSQAPDIKNIQQVEGQTIYYSTEAAYLAARIWLSTEGLAVEGAKPKVKFETYNRIFEDFTTGKISHAIVPSSWLPLLYFKTKGTLFNAIPNFNKGATLGLGLYVTLKNKAQPTFSNKLDLFLSLLDQAYQACFTNPKEAIEILKGDNDKIFPAEVLLKKLAIVQENYTKNSDLTKNYQHSLKTILDVEAVSEIKEYPGKSFLGVIGK